MDDLPPFPQFQVRVYKAILCSRWTQIITTTIMLGAALLGWALVLAGTLQNHGPGNFAAYAHSTDYKVTCKKIARSVSSASQVFYPGEPRVGGL
jgi:hypothetical protein